MKVFDLDQCGISDEPAATGPVRRPADAARRADGRHGKLVEPSADAAAGLRPRRPADPGRHGGPVLAAVRHEAGVVAQVLGGPELGL